MSLIHIYPAQKDSWDAKYDFLRYGVTYGAKDYFHLWMMMEVGGICWGCLLYTSRCV